MPEPGIAIGLFAYSGVEPTTHQCLVRDLLQMKGRQVEYICSWDDADLGRTRANIAAKFLAGKCDVLIMIDHDIIWNVGDLERLAQTVHERQAVVGPAVPKRAFGKGLASAVLEEFPLEWIGQDHVVKAKWVAGAVLCAPRAAVAAVSALDEVQTRNGPMPFMQMKGPDGTFMTEDWAFCVRANRLGFPCLLDTKPVIGHHGRHVYTINDAFRE